MRRGSRRLRGRFDLAAQLGGARQKGEELGEERPDGRGRAVGVDEIAKVEAAGYDGVDGQAREVTSVAPAPFQRRVLGPGPRPGDERETAVARHLRMAVEGEGIVGAAPDADRRSLEEAERRIEVDGLHRFQVGRGSHGELVARLMGVAADGDYRQVGVVEPCASGEPSLAVGHQGQFAEGHAVDGRNRQSPHTT